MVNNEMFILRYSVYAQFICLDTTREVYQGNRLDELSSNPG